MSNPTPNARKLALDVLTGVVKEGLSTAQTLPAAQKKCSPRDLGLLQQLVLGTLQHWFTLQAELNDYLQKPLKAKDGDIQCLLSLGLFQIRHSRIPAHAAISETVNLCPKRKQWARGLCNAVLRRASQAEPQDAPSYDLPPWLLSRFKQDWPEQWQNIASQSSQAAGITLRSIGDRDSLLTQLQQQDIDATAHAVARQGIQLGSRVDITQLPGFEQGAFVVQDGAAQLAAELLAPEDGETILDACAAPGGKTTHILQLAPNAKVTALDSEAKRLKRVEENLGRLKQQAQVIAADARDTQSWWDGALFDRI